MNYLVADLITRIKNAALAHRREVDLPYSKLSLAIAKVLIKEGYLKTVVVEEKDTKKNIAVEVAYRRRVPVLTDILVISKPSLRVYVDIADLGKKSKRGRKTLIVSTSKGVMTGKEAQKEGIGGELLFEIQ